MSNESKIRIHVTLGELDDLMEFCGSESAQWTLKVKETIEKERARKHEAESKGKTYSEYKKTRLYLCHSGMVEMGNLAGKKSASLKELYKVMCDEHMEARSAAEHAGRLRAESTGLRKKAEAACAVWDSAVNLQRVAFLASQADFRLFQRGL